MDMFGGSCHGGTDMSEEQSELFSGLHDKCTLPMWPCRQMLSWPIKGLSRLCLPRSYSFQFSPLLNKV